MTPPLLLLGAVNLLVAVVIIGVCIPLVRGQIKMNPWYGIRTPKAFVSEDNWFKLNTYGGRALIHWNIPLIPLGLIDLAVGWFLPESPITLGWVSISAVFLAILPMGALIQILRWSRNLPG